MCSKNFFKKFGHVEVMWYIHLPRGEGGLKDTPPTANFGTMQI